MKFKLTTAYEGVVVRTRWRRWWDRNKSFVTGIVKFSSIYSTEELYAPSLLQRAQLWHGLNNWIWIEYTCDTRSFKILPEEEALIWRIEHNM